MMPKKNYFSFYFDKVKSVILVGNDVYFHMMPNKNYFFFYVDTVESVILVGNDATYKSLN